MPRTGLIGGPEMAQAGTAPETAPAKAPLMNGRAAHDGLVLAVEEAQALAEKYRSKPLPWMEERAKDLDQKLAGSDAPIARVRVLVFEWESGLGD